MYIKRKKKKKNLIKGNDRCYQNGQIIKNKKSHPLLSIPLATKLVTRERFGDNMNQNLSRKYQRSTSGRKFGVYLITLRFFAQEQMG